MLLNKKGVSMLYVLMALVCVGAMGSLVLSMAKKEKADSSLRYSSELARYGATGGLVLAVNEPLRTKEFEDLMQKWYKVYYGQTKETIAPNDKWLKLGEGYDYSNGKYYEDEKNNKMKLRARVVNVDFSGLQQNPPVINIMIECESIDKSGSRAKNVAFYKIYGFEEERKENIPQSALYMGGGMDEINSILEVTGIDANTKGDTFLRGSANIKTNGNTFGNLAMYKRTGSGGEFRFKASGDWNTARDLKGSIFYGPAYLGTDETQQVNLGLSGNYNTFYGKFGLDTNVSVHADGDAGKTVFYNDVYIKGKIANTIVNGWTFPTNDMTGLAASITKKGAIYKYNSTNDNYGIIAINQNQSDNAQKFGFSANKGDTTIKIMYDTASKLLDGQTLKNAPSNHSENMSIDKNEHILDDFLKMGDEPKPISVNLTPLGGINAFSQTVNNKKTGITGADLNSEYQKQKNENKLYRYSGMPPEKDGWMLVNLNDLYGSIFAADGAGDVFTGKIVLVISGDVSGNPGGSVNLFTSATNSNSLILVEDKRNATQLGHNALIRGLIVKRGVGYANITPRGKNMVLRGAAYCVDGGQLRTEGGQDNKVTIEYDPSALTEIMKELPEVVCIGGKCDNSDSDSKLKDLFGDFSKISAKQVSRLF